MPKGCGLFRTSKRGPTFQHWTRIMSLKKIWNMLSPKGIQELLGTFPKLDTDFPFSFWPGFTEICILLLSWAGLIIDIFAPVFPLVVFLLLKCFDVPPWEDLSLETLALGRKWASKPWPRHQVRCPEMLPAPPDFLDLQLLHADPCKVYMSRGTTDGRKPTSRCFNYQVFQIQDTFPRLSMIHWVYFVFSFFILKAFEFVENTPRSPWTQH